MKFLSPFFLLLALVCSFSAGAQVQTGQVYHLRSNLDVHYYLSAVDQKTTYQNYITTNQTTPTDQASRWTLEDAGGGYFYFKNGGGMYLDVARASKESGARLWLYSRNPGGDAQKFRVKSAGDGAYYIHPKTNEALALDVYKGNAARNSVVWCVPLNRTDGQKWKFIPTTSGSSKPSAPAPTSKDVIIPKAKMIALGDLVLGTLKVNLNNFGSRHRDANGDINWFQAEGSTIQFMGRSSTFTIPQYVHGARDKMHFVNDIRSTRFTSGFDGARFVLNATFEEDGAEIKGMCSNCAKFREDNASLDFNFQNNRWKIFLRLVPYGDSFTFEIDDVKFMGQVDGRVFGELFEGIVQRQLEPKVKEAIRDQLNGQKAAIAAAIKQGAAAAGYRWSSVRSVRVDGNNVVIVE